MLYVLSIIGDIMDDPRQALSTIVEISMSLLTHPLPHSAVEAVDEVVLIQSLSRKGLRVGLYMD